jgi:DNA topoisomerase-1
MHLVVVESPAKAKTINKYLGKDYEVLASYGHVRDLPAKDGSVDTANDFAMVWEADAKGAKRIKDIADALKNADTLILATDPDREGEAISWHLVEALRARKALKKDHIVQRVSFNSITKGAILEAMSKPRDIDMELVEAYLARRALDYLVGFNLSPVLWRKLPGARSAGRVQSVALRIVCEREMEIEAFKSQEYWTVEADLTANSPQFTARLTRRAGKKLDKFDIATEADAKAAATEISAAKLTITSIEQKPTKRTPPPPFTTSTLQQEAARKLGFSPARTMQTAQRLYEGVDIGGETTGLITYMRTDGVQVSQEALVETRAVIAEHFGQQYMPEAPRYYKSKAKNAQEAHEAIRPTSLKRHPDSLNLESDQKRLYEMIWKRMMASQMEAARLERTSVDIDSADGQLGLRATGQVVTFDGYFAVYVESFDDAADDEDSKRLPALSEGATTTVIATKPEHHVTEPPPRYSEASLVKRLEELGIGRPSTYASTLQVLQERSYVRLEKGRLYPEDKGRLVTAFLIAFFDRYVQYDFTANLENELDEVSAGTRNWKELLAAFWTAFSGSIAETKDLKISDVLDALNESLAPHYFPDLGDGKNPRLCPTCGSGTLGFKLGKFGAFIGCSNYPECRHTRPLAAEAAEAQEGGERELGLDENGQPINLKVGRFGPYVELGAAEKRASLPKGWSPADITLEQAIRLLSLPRTIGAHPESGKDIIAGLGRFGPYVACDGTYASLGSVEEAFEVGINRAVTLIAEKKAGGFKKRGAAEPLRIVGAHPATGSEVKLFAGKYGPYVAADGVNASLPRGGSPDTLTLDEAVALLAARAEKGGGKKKPVKKAAAKKPAAKAATAKKAPAKKTAAKKPAAKKAVKP